jgi:magnesium and cobalt exporter, CNNM family
MILYLFAACAAAAALLSLVFSTLTYSLREFSRQRLAEFLGRHNTDHWFEVITENTADLTFLTAVARQFSNILMWVMVFATFEETAYNRIERYAMTVLVAGVIAVICSILIPHGAAKFGSAEIVGFFAPFLGVLQKVFSPVAKLMHGTENIFRRAFGQRENGAQEHIEEEILSAVEEGEKEGVVDEQERRMIESVIEFAGTTVAQNMTTRPDIAAVPADAGLDDVKRRIDASGHSRIPVYEGTLDHVVGILHARDLIKFVGAPAAPVNLRDVMRPAFFVPETKLLRHLLSDFRAQKVHIAVVLDEYGSTAGLITIEDILEELVGEISDEHEPAEPGLFRKIDDRNAEADAKISIEQLNRLLPISIPEGSGFETLGGFLISSLSRIPEKGSALELDGVRYTVLDAEPQRVKRVKIELLPAIAAKIGG